jgi:gamma-glutamyltranspeptidase / glutathione hydrolase
MKKREAASTSWRPTIAGSHYAVSSGHYLATTAAMRVLDAGGNAVDAGVTAAFALAILQPDVVSFAGVAPTLVYRTGDRSVTSLAGLGYWPAATDVSRLREVGGKSVPEGILRQIVPAAPATHIEALRRFGTITFEQAITPAYLLARDGFYVYPELRDSLDIHGKEIDRFAENAATFRPGGRAPELGSRLKQANLARTLERMIEAERNAGGDRAAH